MYISLPLLFLFISIWKVHPIVCIISINDTKIFNFKRKGKFEAFRGARDVTFSLSLLSLESLLPKNLLFANCFARSPIFCFVRWICSYFFCCLPSHHQPPENRQPSGSKSTHTHTHTYKRILLRHFPPPDFSLPFYSIPFNSIIIIVCMCVCARSFISFYVGPLLVQNRFVFRCLDDDGGGWRSCLLILAGSTHIR